MSKTIEEVQQATAKLRKDIEQLCREFYEQTGCRVVEIHAGSFSTAYQGRLMEKVRVEIDAGF